MSKKANSAPPKAAANCFTSGGVCKESWPDSKQFLRSRLAEVMESKRWKRGCKPVAANRGETAMKMHVWLAAAPWRRRCASK